MIVLGVWMSYVVVDEINIVEAIDVDLLVMVNMLGSQLVYIYASKIISPKRGLMCGVKLNVILMTSFNSGY